MANLNISTSKLNAFRDCPRKYYFSEIEQLRPRVTSDKLVIGIGYHLCLDAYYLGGHSESAALDMYAAWKRVLAEEVFSPEEYASTDEEGFDAITTMTLNCLMNYIEFAKVNDDFEVLDVEKEFELPVWTPEGKVYKGVIHKGTIDLIVTDSLGNIKPLEHKTGVQFPQETFLLLDDQISTYMLACKELYHEASNHGFYDMSRKVKNPGRARTELVKRFSLYRSSRELWNTAVNMYYTVRDIKYTIRYGFCHERYNPSSECSWKCPYVSLCRMMNSGEPWRELADAMFFVEDPNERVSWKDKITALAEGGK